jgi:hypothetical protein
MPDGRSGEVVTFDPCTGKGIQLTLWESAARWEVIDVDRNSIGTDYRAACVLRRLRLVSPFEVEGVATTASEERHERDDQQYVAANRHRVG